MMSVRGKKSKFLFCIGRANLTAHYAATLYAFCAKLTAHYTLYTLHYTQAKESTYSDQHLFVCVYLDD